MPRRKRKLKPEQEKTQRDKLVHAIADEVVAKTFGYRAVKEVRADGYREVFPTVQRRCKKGKSTLTPEQSLRGTVNDAIWEYMEEHAPKEPEDFHLGHALEDMDPQDDFYAHTCRAMGNHELAEAYNAVRVQAWKATEKSLRKSLMKLFTGKED